MLFAIISLFLGAAAANDDIKSYYESAKPPRPSLTTEEARDNTVFKDLKIPAVLAIVKFELAKGNWPEVSMADRKLLIAIIDDPNLNFIYTGKQSTLAHSSGGQTIDANVVKIHQDGLYATGAPRGYHHFGKILLHEVGHVYHMRHNYLPRPGRSKEWFSESLEKQLPATNFSPATVAVVEELLKCPDVSGIYKGELTIDSVPDGSAIKKGGIRPGTFEIEQSGCAVTLKFGGNSVKGTYVISTADRDAITLNQEATGPLYSATLKFKQPGSSQGDVEVEFSQKSGGGTVVSKSVAPFKMR